MTKRRENIHLHSLKHSVVTREAERSTTGDRGDLITSATAEEQSLVCPRRVA